jgi:hypothetical protein
MDIIHMEDFMSYGHMKYIAFEDANGRERALMFPEMVMHSDIARACRKDMEGRPQLLLSAGFVCISGKAYGPCPECGRTETNSYRMLDSCVWCTHCGYTLKPGREGGPSPEAFTKVPVVANSAREYPLAKEFSLEGILMRLARNSKPSGFVWMILVQRTRKGAKEFFQKNNIEV